MSAVEHHTTNLFHVLGKVVSKLCLVTGVKGHAKALLCILHVLGRIRFIFPGGLGLGAFLEIHLIGGHPLGGGHIEERLITRLHFSHVAGRIGDGEISSYDGVNLLGVALVLGVTRGEHGGELLLGLGEVGGHEAAELVGGHVAVHHPGAKDRVVLALSAHVALPRFADHGVQLNLALGVVFAGAFLFNLIKDPLKLAPIIAHAFFILGPDVRPVHVRRSVLSGIAAVFEFIAQAELLVPFLKFFLFG